MSSASTIVAALTDVLPKANTWLIDFGNRIMGVFTELDTDSLLSWNSEWLEPVPRFQFEDVDMDELMQDMVNAMFGLYHAEEVRAEHIAV